MQTDIYFTFERIISVVSRANTVQFRYSFYITMAGSNATLLEYIVTPNTGINDPLKFAIGSRSSEALPKVRTFTCQVQ